ncbi:MAG TPA: glycosyltransferase family 39 protein [Anaerolineae bacterium]|nr:glycosyltransferase family 39 protein [Anaerolineae bacterium]
MDHLGGLCDKRANLRRYVPSVLFFVALLPRLLSLGTFVTWDEPMWTYRSIRFLSALLQWDLSETFLVGHPGVVTMICGSIGVAVRRFVLGRGAADFAWLSELPSLDPWNVEALRRLGPFLLAAKVPMAVLNAACVAGIYSLTRRFLDTKTAILAALLVALDPFHLALSRVLHIDAGAANLMTLSVLGLLVYLRHHSRRCLLLSGALAGAALLTKSYSLFLPPFTGLLLAVACLVRRKHLREAAWPFVLWCLGAAGVFFALWPAMWVDPIFTVQSVFGTAFGYAATLSETSEFFLGRVWDDPGSLFYPVAIAFRTTPVVWLALLAIVIRALGNLRDRKKRALSSLGQSGTMIFLVYAGLFAVLMSLAAKKFDRYMLPAIVALDILAAASLTRMMDSLARRKLGALIPAALIIQGAFVLSYHPYYFAYYNPLVGGTHVAPKTLPVGWGEGMNLAADYLNRKEGAGELAVATGGIPGFAPLFRGRVEELTEHGLATTDYALLYISDVQQNSSVIAEFRGRQPEHVVRVRGMDYVWIYPNTQHAELAFYLESQVGAEDVVVLDALSPLVRHCPIPCHTIDNGSEAEAVTKLIDFASGYQRLWYVAYPEGDPHGWIDYQLRTNALLIEQTTFPRVAVSCYLLPVQPAFGGPRIQAALDINFGGLVRLASYGFTKDVLEYRQELGITLRWEAQRTMADNYALSLHLLDGEGHSWAQEDAWLLNPSGLPTAAWEAGESAEACHLLSIPPGIPPGRYRVSILVYQTDTMEKVIVLDTDGYLAGTEYILGTISIASPTVQPTLEDLAIPHALSHRLNDQLEFLGYGLSSGEVTAGDTVKISLFWRSLCPMKQDYDLLLGLKDKTASIELEAVFPLPNDSYPTSEWRIGETLRTPYDLLIEADVPMGRYQLFGNLLDSNGMELVSGGFTLTELDVGGREHLFVSPEIRFPMRADVAHSAALIGYDLDSTSIGPGGTLRLTLYWQPAAGMGRSYTVFSHLVDSQGRVWGQKDSVPCGGACPTTSWLEGEFIADEYGIKVDPDAPAGEYQIKVGMYDPESMDRLPAFDEIGRRWPDNCVVLWTSILVR